MPFTLGGDFIDNNEIERQARAKKPLRITKEKRKNSQVTLIHNLPISSDQMTDLLKALKGHLGAGGSIKDDVIQIQGDHSKKIEQFLKEKGTKFGL